jgi:hypothetical protein
MPIRHSVAHSYKYLIVALTTRHTLSAKVGTKIRRQTAVARSV